MFDYIGIFLASIFTLIRGVEPPRTIKSHDGSIKKYIPKIIWMTSKSKENIPENVVENWRKLNPDYEVRHFDDTDCRASFTDKELEIFDFIKHGDIKADFWRVVTLLKHGGYYVDIDIKPFRAFDDYVDEDTQFATCFGWTSSIPFAPMYNPHFIAAVPEHPYLNFCYCYYFYLYQRKWAYCWLLWSIVIIMEKAINKIGTCGKSQFFSEICPGSVYAAYCYDSRGKIFNSRYPDYDTDKKIFTGQSIGVVRRGWVRFFLYIMKFLRRI